MGGEGAVEGEVSLLRCRARCLTARLPCCLLGGYGVCESCHGFNGPSNASWVSEEVERVPRSPPPRRREGEGADDIEACWSHDGGQWDVLDRIPVSSFIQPANGRVVKLRVHSPDKHGLHTYRSGS